MKNKEFITILIITLIVVVIWVISDLVHTKSDTDNLPDVKQYLDPINPTFDKRALDKISTLATPAPAPSNLPQASIATSSSATSRATPRPSLSPSPSASASSTPRI